MPEMIGNHGLYCPEFDDYAAVALYMQDLGTRIDEALFAQQTLLEGFLAPPAIILTNSGVVTINTVDLSDNNIFDTVVANTSTFMNYDATTGELFIGSENGAATTVPYLRGAYTIGAGARMSAAGAVTVGSGRSLELRIIDDTQAPVFPAFEFVISSPVDFVIDQNTGGDYGLNVKTNVLLNRTSGVRVTHVATSLNLASNTTIPAGSAFLYVIYNGPTDIVEVA